MMLKVMEKLAPIARLSGGNLYKQVPERDAKKREDAVRVLEHIPATEAVPAVPARPAKGNQPAQEAQPAKPAKPADVKVIWYLPIVSGDGKLFDRHAKLEAAVLALLNAPHRDHFSARLGDEELAAVETMQSLFTKTEKGFTAPDGNGN